MQINLIYFMRIFIMVAVISFFYWEVFHRICVRALRFRLFALRDDLRRMAGEKGLGPTKEFRGLEHLICVIISHIPNISFLSFLLFKSPPISERDREDLDKFEHDAPSEFLDMRSEACKCAIMIMMLNSPWIVAVSSFAVLPLWALGKISGPKICRKTEVFIGDLPQTPHLTLPSARIA